ADLTGVRRGHVSIACSQALLPWFLPAQIAEYRGDHPGVTFTVNVRDRSQAERDLSNYSSDLALVFEPILMVDFELISTKPQPVCAVFAESHPLAAKKRLRLRDCLDHPHVLPANGYAVRHLLEVATSDTSRRLAPIAESDSFEFMLHYVQHEQAVCFQFPVGLPASELTDVVVRPLPASEVSPGFLRLGQLKGRTLPVAAALFARQLHQALEL
ncbi:MAG: LysR substrate-binding domain-containing protein, partial [Pseudomonadota bacterium]